MKNSELQETSQEKIITSLLNIPGAKIGLLNSRSSRRVLTKIIVLNSFMAEQINGLVSIW